VLLDALLDEMSRATSLMLRGISVRWTGESSLLPMEWAKASTLGVEWSEFQETRTGGFALREEKAQASQTR
jgi:hypothetical protein